MRRIVTFKVRQLRSRVIKESGVRLPLSLEPVSDEVVAIRRRTVAEKEEALSMFAIRDGLDLSNESSNFFWRCPGLRAFQDLLSESLRGSVLDTLQVTKGRNLVRLILGEPREGI